MIAPVASEIVPRVDIEEEPVQTLEGLASIGDENSDNDMVIWV